MPPEENAAVDTLSAHLAAAWDASEDEIHPETPPEPETTPAEELAAAPEPPESDAGDEVPPETNEAPTADVLPSEKAAEDDKAPVGLSPEAREVWKDVPPAVKADIAKREADFANGIKQYAEAAKRVEGMDKVLAPYSQYFAMNGGAGNTLPGLLQTGAMLQMGGAQQKAEAVAGIIKQFGVDIRTLDNLLMGEAPTGEVQQTDQFNQMLNQRLAPMQEQLSAYQQREKDQQQQEQEVVAEEVDTFATNPKNEFYNDIKMDMADLMDMAAQRGQKLTMQQAYDKACAIHPTISQIIASRAGQQNVNDKRRAASSISGGPGGAGGTAQHNSLRSAIEDAWENDGRT